jgi:fumarate hydratase class I
MDKVNALGIGAQGLGGLATVLDVKILDFPTHAASLPVAMIPNCAATRHAHFTLDGSGAAKLEPPDLDAGPTCAGRRPAESRRVDLDTLTPAEVASWKPGERLLLNGRMLTGRDAAHKRIVDMLAKGEPLPVDFTQPRHLLRRPGRPGARRGRRARGADDGDAHGQVHRSDAREDGAGRDGRQGRARPVAIEAIRKHQAAYLMAVGGAAYLVAKAIRGSRVVRVRRPRHGGDLRVRRARHAGDRRGRRGRHVGPRDRAGAMWRARIGKIRVATA